MPPSFDDAHALVIGVSQYQHVAKLRPTEDVPGIVAALVDPALCAYPPAHVRILLEEQATRAAILDELTALAARTTERSTVLIYFSGHGGRVAPDGEPASAAFYLLPVDCQSKPRALLDATAISAAEWTARCNALPAARLTIVLDCCRAAELAEADLPLSGGDLDASSVSPLARGRGRVVLAASRGDGSAYALPGQAHSVFTGYLLRGLRGEAQGVGGVLRICDLFHYVQQHVVAEQPLQRPVFKAELEENYPVALWRGGSASATGEPFALPPPPDEARYDLFLSYAASDEDDSEWARRVAIPLLEQLGLRICHEKRDFNLTQRRLSETERAVAESRYSAAVFSPAYLADRFADYQAMLAAFAAVESGEPRFIPLMRKPCDLELHRRMTAALDVSRDDEVTAALQRLAVAARQPPHPRLS